MRLLLAEDDAQLGKTLLKGLRQESYAVDIVADGENAVYQALINEYDVIILDVMMPKIDGWQALEMIKSDPDLFDCPVVLITVNDDFQKGNALGAAAHLVKPVDRESLERVLAQICPYDPAAADGAACTDEADMDNQAQLVAAK